MEDRLMELETRLTYVEDANQTLSDGLIAAREQIDQLQHQIKKLRGEFEQATEAGNAADERPPHY